MIFYSVSVPAMIGDIFSGDLRVREQKDPYEVLTLYRDLDNVCVVRLRGFDNTVFWKEIKLNSKFSFGKSPRQKIVEAQEKARKKADKLRWRDIGAEHEFNLSIR